MTYQFDVDAATKYGVEPAILIYALKWWIRKNAIDGRNQHPTTIDGKEVTRTWTYFKRKDRESLFPFWKENKFYRIIEKLLKAHVLIKGNFNKTSYDRTMWFAFADEEAFLELPAISQKREMEVVKTGNGISENGETIPVLKPVTKPNRKRGAAPSLSQSPSEPGVRSGNGQGKQTGKHCTDPVILAYRAEHEAECGFQPRINYRKVNDLLADLRAESYTDEQLIRIVKAARRSRAWFRKDSFNLLTILSAGPLNEILQDNPLLRKDSDKPKPRDPCPVCGGTSVLSGQCGVCHFDLRSVDRTPKHIKDCRFQAIWRGILKPSNEQEKADAEAWHERCVAEMEEHKKKLAGVAA